MQVEAPLVSKARMGLILFQISEQYCWWSPEFARDDPDTILSALSDQSLRSWATPSDFTSLYWAVISHLFENLSGVAELEQEQLSEESGRKYFTGVGLPDVYLSSGRRADRGLVESLRDAGIAEQNRGDILTLQYMGLDNSRPLLRLCVAAFYLIGFSVLMVPTILTFAQLVASIWR